MTSSITEDTPPPASSPKFDHSPEPVIKHRFTAQIELQEDTFTVEGKEGRVTWIIPVARAGDTRAAYGIATSTQHAGTWQTEFELENDPVTGIGQPRGFFEGRVIARGSEEEESYLDELRAQQEAEAEREHQKEMARRRREEELREQERQAELARIAHEERVTEEERKRQEQEAATAEAERKVLVSELTERAQNRFAIDLPGYWELTSFEAGEVVFSKGNGAPLVERDFYARVKLVQDTFAKVEEDEPVVLLAPVAEAGATRKVYGLLHARRDENGWVVSIDPENEPTANTGQPRGFFEGRVIIRGTPEEEAYQQEKLQAEIAERRRQAALDEQARQAEMERVAAEEKKREQQRHAELARLEHERRLKEEQQKVELARAAFEVELQKRREEKTAAERAARERELAAFRSALQSDYVGKRTRAVEVALTGSDEAMRIAALQSALQSRDEALKRMAMLDVLSRHRTISGILSTQDRTYEGSFTIGVGDFSNSGNGVARLSGSLGGASFSHYSDQNRKVVGTISGLNIDLGNERCSLSARLVDDASMEGKMSCQRIKLGELGRQTTTVDVKIALF